MNWRMIRTLVVKDLSLYFRNRFFAFVTVLALVFYAVIYFVLPNTVDESLQMALYGPEIPPVLADVMDEEGVDIRRMASEDALKEAVQSGEYPVGFVFPAGLNAQIAAGDVPVVNAYFNADIPPEFEEIYTLMLQELAFTMSGQGFDLQVKENILGRDMAGQQVPPRDRMLPLFAVFILLMETLGLASLFTNEIEAGTIEALLITPLRVEGFFLGKAITGVGMAFVQAGLLMLVTGGLARQAGLILLALFLGALLATGLAFIIASVARDMMSVMGWGVLAIVSLAIPAFNILLPGGTSPWMKVIPSFYLVDTVYQVVNLEAGWGDMGSNLLLLLAFAVVFFAIGVIVVRRRFR